MSETTPTVLGEGKYFRFLCDNGWEFLQPKRFSDVVMIVPITDDGKLVLIEQYRRPVDAKCIEIPAGLVGDEAHFDGEDIETAARRELLEETGYEADSMEFVTKGCPSAGSNAVVLSFFVARGLRRVGPGGGDETEDIRVMEIPLDGIEDWIEERRLAGNVIDLKTFVGVMLARRAMGG